jgi:hypothetical protein
VETLQQSLWADGYRLGLFHLRHAQHLLL